MGAVLMRLVPLIDGSSARHEDFATSGIARIKIRLANFLKPTPMIIRSNNLGVLKLL
jgi:hypothetical protein